MPTITSISASRFETPLHEPFVTSQGLTTMARGVAAELKLDDGRISRGESVPVTYVTGETCDSVLAAIQAAAPSLVGADVRRYRLLLDRIDSALPTDPSARCGLEMAVLDAWSQTTGLRLVDLWGDATSSVESDVTIPIVPNAGALAETAWAFGIRVFKLKVGALDVEEDHARILDVRRAAPDARLRIDANQAFTPDAAVAFVERLVAEGSQVELLEQPVRKEDFEGLHSVAQRSPVPVFADESCRARSDALRLAALPALAGFNLKINKCGIAGVLDIIAIARSADKRLMLGCMLETRRSIAHSLAIACGTGAFEVIDLDSHMLLSEAGDNPFFRQDGGRLELPAA